MPAIPNTTMSQTTTTTTTTAATKAPGILLTAVGDFTTSAGGAPARDGASSSSSSDSTNSSPTESRKAQEIRRTTSSAFNNGHSRGRAAPPPTPTPLLQRQSTMSSVGSDLIDIPERKQREMIDKVQDTVRYVLDSMVGDRPSSVYWKPKMHKRGVAYYVDDNVNPGQYRFCCVSETAAPATEVMKLFLMTNTETLLKNYRVVYNNVLEARVLSVLEHPTKANPMKSIYVRYSSFATPMLMDNRDMCLVVATNVFRHHDGSTIGYCLWDSVELPECPDMAKSHGLVRSRMFRSGFFLRTSPSTDSEGGGGSNLQTKIVYLVGLEAGGVAPRLATRIVMEKFGANLGRVCEHFRRRNLDPTTFKPRSEWTPKSSVKFCRACLKNFHTLSKRTNCAACGDVICKMCAVKENVDLPGVGITTMRFCVECLSDRGISNSPHNGGAGAHRRSTRARSVSESLSFRTSESVGEDIRLLSSMRSDDSQIML